MTAPRKLAGWKVGALGVVIAVGLVVIVANSLRARSALCREEGKTRGVVRLLLSDARDSTLAQIPVEKRPDVLVDAARPRPRTELGRTLSFYARNLARLDALTC